jgi:chemotaxis protein CheX
MDDAVAEVFERMLERSCSATPEASAIDADFSASITFSGTLEAQCAVEFPSPSAQTLTSAFLGPSEADWDDSMVADSVCELCNMIAGGWKMRLGTSAWGAELSVPSISRGSDRDTPNLGATSVRRAYAFGDSPFVVCLTVS